MKDFLMLCCIIILVVSTFIAGIWGLLANFDRIAKRICNDYEKELNLPVKYIDYGGCLINVDGDWLTPDTYQMQLKNKVYELKLENK